MNIIEPKKIALSKLPSVSASLLGSTKALDFVPHIPVIYFFVLDTGYPAYVGESKNLAYRILFHDKKYWAKEMGVSLIAWLPSEKESYPRRQIEKLFIRYYLPPLNFTIWHGRGSKSHFDELRQLRRERFGVDFGVEI